MRRVQYPRHLAVAKHYAVNIKHLLLTGKDGPLPSSPLRKRLQSHRNVICRGLTLDILSEEFQVRKNNDALIYRRVTGKL